MAVARREVLRFGALSAGSLLGAPLLAACGSGKGRPRGGTPGSAVASSPETKLASFDDTAPGGAATSLPKRVAWANTNDIGIFAALGEGMSKAASDSGMDYITADAKGDAQTNVNQINTFISRGIGGMTIQPLEPAAQEPLMQQAMQQGACVIGIITSPCILQVAASQYEVGFQLGSSAADHITSQLGGKATVFNANLNQIAPQLKVRNDGVLAGLKKAGPGVRIIDQYVAPAQETPENVFSLVQTELQRHPDLNVVLGVDDFVLPAYRAFQQTHRLKDDMYFASIDGDPEALQLVAQGGPYRASHAFAWSLMGYGMGRFVADWIAGKQIPRVMYAKTTVVDGPDAAKSFLADAADPKKVFEDRARYERYLPLLGNVSYEQRSLIWNTAYEP